MNISTRQYAEALYELTKGKDEKAVDAIVLDFAKELKKQGVLKSAGDIMKKFSEIYNKKNGIVEGEVVIAREIDEEQFKKIEDFVKDRYEAKEVSLDRVVDEEIKGGIVLKIGDELIDGSISKKIKKLSVLLKK